MSEELERKMEHVLERLDKRDAPKPIWTKFTVGTIITVVVLVVGIIGSWYTVRAEVSDLRGDLTKVEDAQEKQEEELEDVRLKAVQDSSDIKHIKEKVLEMNGKLDKLLEL